jgi:hypothetical protein
MRLLGKVIVLFFLNFSFVYSNNVSNCFYYTEKYGKEFNLPYKLLTSISLVESGLKKNDKFVSWPWTLNVSGKSKFFETKEQALDYLIKNIKKKKNIDVGCMQISTKYHINEFKNLNNILDPNHNVKYAAKFLKSLYKKHKRWNEAISRYHSSEPQKKEKYLKKVKNYWSNIRQKRSTKIDNKSKREREKIEFFKSQFENRLNL